MSGSGLYDGTGLVRPALSALGGLSVTDRQSIEISLDQARARYALYQDPADADQIKNWERLLQQDDVAVQAAVENAAIARRTEAVRAIREVEEDRNSISAAIRGGVASLAETISGFGTAGKVVAGLGALFLVAQIARALGGRK